MQISRLQLAISLLVVLVAVAIGGVVHATGWFAAQPPENLSRPSAPIPLLAPPSSKGDQQLAHGSVDVSQSAPDDRAVAYLAPVPEALTQSMTVNFPDIKDWTRSESVEFFVLASIRYVGNGHLVLVSTARPSFQAAKNTWVLGDRTVQLADGTFAWASVDKPGDTPNRLVISRDGLVITLASDLPIETLQEFATRVTVKQKSAAIKP